MSIILLSLNVYFFLVSVFCNDKIAVPAKWSLVTSLRVIALSG